MNKPYFHRNFFLTDWRHKRLRNKIDLLLFYREHFYGFSESDIGLYSAAKLEGRLFQNYIYHRSLNIFIFLFPMYFRSFVSDRKVVTQL